MLQAGSTACAMALGCVFLFFFFKPSQLLTEFASHAGDTLEETWIRSLVREDPLEKEMATHSSDLA